MTLIVHVPPPPEWPEEELLEFFTGGIVKE